MTDAITPLTLKAPRLRPGPDWLRLSKLRWGPAIGDPEPGIDGPLPGRIILGGPDDVYGACASALRFRGSAIAKYPADTPRSVSSKRAATTPSIARFAN